MGRSAILPSPTISTTLRLSNFIGLKLWHNLQRFRRWRRSMRRNSTSPQKLSRRVADDRLVVANSYVLSFEAERFYRGCRYHWMICSVQNPDELISWGYAPTRELAETAAGSEVNRLESGLPRAGRARQLVRRLR